MTTEKAGAQLYKTLLQQYQSYRESAERDMNQYAREFTRKQKEEDRAMFLVAQAKSAAWDEAIRILTQNGGDWLRLDFAKEGD